MRIDATRSDLIQRARLHHATFAVSGLFHPLGASPHAFRGDAREGAYFYDNGSGDFYALGWDERGLVGLVFSHESDRSEYDLEIDERDPYAHLPRFPDARRPLAEQLLASELPERLVTSGLWAEGEVVELAEPWDPTFSHGLELLWRYGLSARDAMLGEMGVQPWVEIASLTDEHAEVLVALIERSRGGPVEMTGDERDVLLRAPPDDELHQDELDAFWEQLGAIGILPPG